MGVFSGIVIFLLIWWVVIFCMLPLNVESIKDTSTGNMPGAPEHHGLKRKLILTTIIACVIWLIIYLIICYGGISFQDMAARMPM